MEKSAIGFTYFKGIRDDIGPLFAAPDFMYNIQNFNSDSIIGSTRNLFPEEITDLGIAASEDGIVEFRYLNAESIDVTQQICVVDGKIYSDCLSDSPKLLKSGLTPGKVSFQTYQDKLFIFNGLNYPQIYNGTVVTEMGAPTASNSGVVGNPSGTYFYELTYVTAGGEECTGTRSNTISVTSTMINLELPIGYTGTTARKLYRTTNGGTTPKLVATISDNTTLTYVDNTADGSLGADIIAVNHECPKPYFAKVAFSRLIGGKVDLYPTYLFPTDPNIEVFDRDVFADVSGIDGDNTAIQGMSLDYTKIIVGTRKNLFVVDASQNELSVTRSRANVGIENGYSCITVPAAGETGGGFPGGVMFLSTDLDVRVFNGNFEQPVATSLDNLKTENYSQVVKTSLTEALNASNPNISAIYFDYKYILSINDIEFVYDIRTSQWFHSKILTASYSPSYNCFGQIGQNLYAGRVGTAVIERFYSTVFYRDEPVKSFIRSEKISGPPEIASLKKYITAFYIYFNVLEDRTMTVELTGDSDVNNKIIVTFDLGSGAFVPDAFNQNDFSTINETEDYRVIHINRYARYFEFEIKSDFAINIRGYKLEYMIPSNKE